MENGAVANGAVAKKSPTQLSFENPRSIITFQKTEALGFDRSINPYRGCEHGCIYCFARPSHAFMGLSPGLDFEQKIIAKPNAPILLRRALAHKNYRPRFIQIGSNTDAYQPVERQQRLMRGILKVLSECAHPIAILTKSALILRDMDLLQSLAKRRLVRVCLSLTTLDVGLHRAMEPRASAPAKRLVAIEALAKADIPVGVMVAPLIPGLNDQALEEILCAARDHGAGYAHFAGLRLDAVVARLFLSWLEQVAPHRRNLVLRQMGMLKNDALCLPKENETAHPLSQVSKLMGARFAIARRRLGFQSKLPPLDCSQFTPPLAPSRQLDLFVPKVCPKGEAR